jgi:hypothetical protein
MTAISGTNGSVYLSGTPLTPLASITQWDCTVTGDNYAADVFGVTWHQFVIGIKGWSGTLTGYYDIPNDPNGQLVVWNALYESAPIVLNLQTIAGGGLLEGTAHITQAVLSVPVNNVITCNFSYVGNGSLQPNFG